MLTEQLAKFALLGAEWVLYVLLFLSILSIVLIVDRTIFILKRRATLKKIESEFASALEQGRESEWRERVLATQSLEAGMLGRIFQVLDRRGDVPGGVVDSITSEYRQSMERYLTFLGTLGSNAPFVGLFGTVIGIIKAFHTLNQDMEAGATGLMGDIYEALVATGAGLAVAIPAVIAYNAFIRSSDGSVSRFSALVHGALSLGETIRRPGNASSKEA